MPSGDGGLGQALVGEKFAINGRNVHVSKLLGEGGFSYVYLCKEISDTTIGQSLHNTVHGDSKAGNDEKPPLVLKVTSIHSRQQRDIAEKEAKLLSRLSHPSIIKMFDTCYRTDTTKSSGFLNSKDSGGKPQHLILMEYCEGGHSLDVCNQLAAEGKRFDLSTLIIAFGQICNAVSYLHAQRPPIVHRDLKPVNFLIKNGAYKLCDFGSAVFGHVDLRTPKARSEAEEVIEKTTTQMFRAPEMVDLYSTKRLTQSTDVWALGCCLYSLAFLQNCFEEGSNLAILSRKYKIPDDNPYGDGLVELLDRMLTVDPKARSDMTEVILCLSAVYSGRPLPPRKKVARSKKSGSSSGAGEKGEGSGTEAGGTATKAKKKKEKTERTGTFRTDGQGIYRTDGQGIGADAVDGGIKKKAEPKKLNPNSAAARRRIQAQAQGDKDMDFSSFHSRFSQSVSVAENEASKAKSTDPFAFSSTENFFASVPEGQGEGTSKVGDAFGTDVFGSFDQSPSSSNDKAKEAFAAFDNNDAWGDGVDGGNQSSNFNASFSAGDGAASPSETEEDAIESLRTGSKEDSEGGGRSGSTGHSAPRNRGVRRCVSETPGPVAGRSRQPERARRSRKPHDAGGREHEDHSLGTEHADATKDRNRSKGGGEDEKKRGGSRSHSRNDKPITSEGDRHDKHPDRHSRDKHVRREKEESSAPRRSKSHRGVLQTN